MAEMIARLRALIHREWKRVFWFGVIGVTSLLLTMGLYALVSRVMWVGGPHTVEYVAVVIVVTWVNYELNRYFTFDRATRSRQNVARFISVALAAMGLNAMLFWLGHDVLHQSDFLVIIATTFFVAGVTFTSHRLFTFRVTKSDILES